MQSARMCITKYLDPTNHRGSRVKATHVTTKRSVTLLWDFSVSVEKNHLRAAYEVLGGSPDTYASIDGGGYIFSRKCIG